MKKFLLILTISLVFSSFKVFNDLKNSGLEEETDLKKLEGHLLYNYVNENHTEVQSILEQIKTLDESIYSRDIQIIKYWYYIDDVMHIHTGVAPDGLPNTNDHAFVVLGYKLNSDGSLKKEAIGRCDVAYESAMKYPNSLVFVTGGGTASKNKNVTEGGQMMDYLVNVRGLDPERIVVEDKAMDTIQNAEFTVLKLIEYNIKTITVITSDYHIRRGNILFKGQTMVEAERLGIEPMEILENAAWVTGKKTEGKLAEGHAIASILDVKLGLKHILKLLPKIITTVYNYFSSE